MEWLFWQVGPATVRAYAKAEPYSSRPAVTEDGKTILFGQTAASAKLDAALISGQGKKAGVRCN